MHRVSGCGGGIYCFSKRGRDGRSSFDTQRKPSSHIFQIVADVLFCSSVFSFFFSTFLWVASSAFTFALLSSTVDKDTYCVLASGEIVSPERGRFSLNVVRGPAFNEYHVHPGGPSVLNPAVFTAARSPAKSENSASNRRRPGFHRRFT